MLDTSAEGNGERQVHKFSHVHCHYYHLGFMLVSSIAFRLLYLLSYAQGEGMFLMLFENSYNPLICGGGPRKETKKVIDRNMDCWC